MCEKFHYKNKSLLKVGKLTSTHVLPHTLRTRRVYLATHFKSVAQKKTLRQ